MWYHFWRQSLILLGDLNHEKKCFNYVVKTQSGKKYKINHIENWWCACWHKRTRLELDVNEWIWEWRQGRGDTSNLSLLQGVPVFYFRTERLRVPLTPPFFFPEFLANFPFPCARMFPWEPLNTTPQIFTLKIWSVCKNIERICRNYWLTS